MQTTISLRAPNIGAAPELATGFVESVAALAQLERQDADDLREATARLVRFALEHAYPEGAEGEIAVEAHLFDGGVRIDVHDWGLPLELERSRAQSGEHEMSELQVPGLDVAGLVDESSFHSLGREGKLFSVVKHCTHDSPVAASAPLLSEHDDHEVMREAADLVVRDFEPGDEEAICQLVYRNYANTYGSEFFYVPEKLLERNRDGEVVSTVALLDDVLVGHHAVLREGPGSLAESGAAVIHPDYKGLGIFNALCEHTLTRARHLGLSALYGQAVTVHPYSQKATYTHGFRESALAVGRARASIRLEGNTLTRTGKRHAIVVHYLCFERPERAIFVPSTYRDQVAAAYAEVELPFRDASAASATETGDIKAGLDAGLNIGTISVGRWEDGDDVALSRAFHYLLAKHCDMVYADVDLERVDRMDEAIEALNRAGFFYSGVMPMAGEGRDQLRLQYENTLDVDEDDIVCWSEYAQELKAFVLADKARVSD